MKIEEKITFEEREKIAELEFELTSKAHAENESNKNIAELIGLYQDIISETSKHGKSTIIYDYAKLLEEELQLFSGEGTYKYAKLFRNKSPEKILSEHIKFILKRMTEVNIYNRKTAIYDEINEMMGNATTILPEFEVTYKKVFGTISNNIDKFIRLAMN